MGAQAQGHKELNMALLRWFLGSWEGWHEQRRVPGLLCGQLWDPRGMTAAWCTLQEALPQIHLLYFECQG